MFITFYISKYLKRSRNWLIIPAILVGLTVLLSLIRNAINTQEEKLNILQNDFPIWMELSDTKGISSDNLSIPNFYIWHFIHESVSPEGYEIYHLVKDVALKHTVDAIKDNLEVSLIGITRRESDYKLSVENGVQVEFYNGYTWDDFLQRQAICIVPANMRNDYIEVFITDDSNILAKEPAPIQLKVIGEVYGGDGSSIYVPWIYVTEDGMEHSEVLRAVVSDNSQLNELKFRMKRYFTYVDFNRSDTEYHFAMTIFDSSYIATYTSVTRNISLLRTGKFAFFIIAVIIGFLTGFLLVRTRRKEIALLRSIGISTRIIVLSFLLGYAIICLTTALFYTLLTIFINPMRQGYIYLPLVSLCFFIGLLIPIIKNYHISILQSLREND